MRNFFKLGRQSSEDLEAPQFLALPPDFDDMASTSDYEPSIGESVFCSVTSSINESVWEYGRRYQVFRYGRYPLPNDDEEVNREILKHVMFKELLHGQLHLAPIGKNPQKIIDLGTGTGEWAIEVGDNFPSARVIGVDLSRIQPVWLPPNVEFYVDDIEDEWIHSSDFDYVHLRVVCSTLRDPKKVLATAYRNMNPGGWIELQEINPVVKCDDGTVPPDYPLTRFYEQMRTVFEEHYGFDPDFVERAPSQLEELGFVNVQLRVFHVPIGEWPKDKHLRTLGAYLREILAETLPAMAAKPFHESGIDDADAKELLQDVRDALRERRFHAYLPIHFVWAQKPAT
ncbi:hypothetical protein VTK73DRAFT_10251 [Phialemonium thermophilum]|uniref:Methyltransferase domain-containing protein n=1 Tax=Phialemonium thermophilum TaxID=223376 RepID=A0ABR3VXN7_9PEZI